MSISCVNLKPLANAAFSTPLIPKREGWGGFPIAAKRLDGFPTGRNVFAGVPFNVAAAGKVFLVLGPEDREGRRLEINAKFANLYLLHAMVQGELGRRPVAFTLHYADGETCRRTLTYGQELSDWLFPAEFANCRFGWSGFLAENEFQKSVYVTELVNPHPDRKVVAIALERTDRRGSYVLLGLTLSAEPPFFKRLAQGVTAGLADQVVLDREVYTLADGVLRLKASLRDSQGRPVAGAKLVVVVAGRKYPLVNGAVAIPRRKQWRQYANAVSVFGRAAGRPAARRDAVFYADGHPRLLTPPHGKKPPQFISLTFDDCKVMGGVESMLEIIEDLKDEGARVVFTMYTSPCEARSPDIEKVKLLYQRMYDLGCEFANHTLNHNPGGVNWFALDHAGQEREITGCRDWLRQNIRGLWHVYTQKSGGGGAKGFSDPKFTRDLMRRQNFEYNANGVTALFDSVLPHPDLQFWPYRLGKEWLIEIGAFDAAAPKVHCPITTGGFTDYSGKFDYEVADGVAMMVANFERHYRNPNRPPFIINSFHEWGLGSYFPSHRHEKAILKGFLREVLVKRKKEFPNTHVTTLHQIVEYMRRDDLPAIIAEGSGQQK